MSDIIDFSAYRKHKKIHKTTSSKKAKKKRQHNKPDRQGHLDSLCGVYAIVNAINAVHRFNDVDRQLIFRCLIKTLEEERAAGTVIIDGISKKQLEALISKAIAHVHKKHKVSVSVKPLFKYPARINVEQYWRVLRQHLETSKKGSVIIGISGRTYHWTCVKSVSRFSMKLYDSSGFKRLHKRSCKIGRPYTDKHYHLLPTQTWFISLLKK